jgi:hypothetical protein
LTVYSYATASEHLEYQKKRTANLSALRHPTSQFRGSPTSGLSKNYFGLSTNYFGTEQHVHRSSIAPVSDKSRIRQRKTRKALPSGWRRAFLILINAIRAALNSIRVTD